MDISTDPQSPTVFAELVITNVATTATGLIRATAREPNATGIDRISILLSPTVTKIVDGAAQQIPTPIAAGMRLHDGALVRARTYKEGAPRTAENVVPIEPATHPTPAGNRTYHTCLLGRVSAVEMPASSTEQGANAIADAVRAAGVTAAPAPVNA